MTQTLSPALRTGVSVAAGGTQNFTVNSGSVNATEANVKVTYRSAGTFSNLFTNIITNAATSTSTFKYRKGGANGNQVLSVGAGVTGELTDVTNTDLLAAGDIIDYQFINGGGGTIAFNAWNMLFSPTTAGNTINKLVSSQAFTDTSVNTTYYFPPVCIQSTAASTEANVQFKNKATATLQNMAILVTANAASVATCASRVNTAAGNLLVSIGSAVTGSLEDTTHTDSLAVNNLFNWAFNSTITTTITFQSIAVDYLTTSGKTHFIVGAANPATILKNVTTFYGIQGFLQTDTTEDKLKTLAQVAFTASNIEAYLPANTVSATSTIDFRINKASGTQTLAIGSNTTGYFEDTTHSDSVVTTDEINYRLVTPNNGTSLTLSYIGCLAAYTAGGTTYNDTLSETVAATDSETGSATDAASLSETGTATTSQIGTETASVTLSETGTSFDSYVGGRATSDTLSETGTVSDSFTGLETGSASLSETGTSSTSFVATATDSASLSETGTSSDLINGAQTVNGSMTETIISSDNFTGLATDSGTLTELGTASDSYTTGAIYSDSLTETSTSSDALIGMAIDNDSLSETVAANDNYVDTSPAPSPTPTLPPIGGSGDDPWRKYLNWLAKKKKKEFKQRAEKLGIAPSKARHIAEVAAQAVDKQEIGLKTPFYAEYNENEDAATNAAQKSILAIYEEVWKQMAVQKREIYAINVEIERIREEDEEDEFFLMMM